MTRLFELTTHAKHDSAHCLTPNLFRSLKRGDRKKLKLDVKYAYGENESIRFTGFEPLDAFDMRILQALTALAGPSDLSLDICRPESNQTVLALDLIKSLNPQHSAKNEVNRVVTVKICSLLRQLGYTNGKKQIKAAEASLYRLANVTFELRVGDKLWVQHILGYGYDQTSRDLFVTLNHRITDAVLNRGGGRHTIINMDEVRAIKSDPAAILHQRLCAIVDPGKKRNFKIETLMSYVWSYEAEDSTMRTRKQTLLKALEEIQKTASWKFEKLESGLYSVARKKYRTKADG